MKKITVLGAGMVGSAIALDLAQNYQITSIDVNEENLLYYLPKLSSLYSIL